MAISGTKSKSFILHLAPGEVAALVPWGEAIAYKIPSIKTDAKGWVIDKTGHLVIVGVKVRGADPLVEKIKKGENMTTARARLDKRIKAFRPRKPKP